MSWVRLFGDGGAIDYFSSLGCFPEPIEVETHPLWWRSSVCRPAPSGSRSPPSRRRRPSSTATRRRLGLSASCRCCSSSFGQCPRLPSPFFSGPPAISHVHRGLAYINSSSSIVYTCQHTHSVQRLLAVGACLCVFCVVWVPLVRGPLVRGSVLVGSLPLGVVWVLLVRGPLVRGLVLLGSLPLGVSRSCSDIRIASHVLRSCSRSSSRLMSIPMLEFCQE